MDSLLEEAYIGPADAADQEPPAGLGADLLAIIARLDRFAAQRVQMPIPAAQARMLAIIEANREARICELAAIDHCAQPTMTNQVQRFEKAGLVCRVLDPRDARAVRIRITAKGVRTLDAVRGDQAAAIEPHLALLKPVDRRVLASAVSILRRLLEEPDGRAVPRR